MKTGFPLNMIESIAVTSRFDQEVTFYLQFKTHFFDDVEILSVPLSFHVACEALPPAWLGTSTVKSSNM